MKIMNLCYMLNATTLASSKTTQVDKENDYVLKINFYVIVGISL